ncbi:MAG TPA: endonuclease/exonuclease/phosphatase family protein [Phycisphaerales bacterium]|nr:endonuclease/exonuclease/phosphatase family protein [Phycisphaerales bacterium]
MLWIAAAPAILLLLAAWLTPARLDCDSEFFTVWSFVAFMARTFTFHAGLGFAAVCIASLLLHARYLVAVTGALGVLIVATSTVRIPTVAAQTTSGDEITLFSHNLLFINTDMTQTLAQVAAAKPDVILFQEYTPAHHAELAPALAADYPYAVHAYRDNFYGQAIYSKRPFLERPEVVRDVITSHGAHAPGNGPQLHVRVLLGDQPVTIQNVHTDAPGSLGPYRAQRQQFAWLRDLASDTRGAVVLAGDFNATNSSQHMGALRSAGMTDALDANALGRGCTWPDRTVLRWVPGVRIDHVLYSRDLECVAAHVGTSTGSDHLPVVAKLRVNQSPRYEEW